MKVLNYLAILCVAIFAAACTNDDEPTTESMYANLAGEYNVHITRVMGQDTNDPVDGVIKVNANSDKLSIVFPTTGSGMMTIPSVEMKDIVVTKTADTYNLSHAPVKIAGKKADGSLMELNFSEGLTGSIKADGTIELTTKKFFAGAMPFSMDVFYKGNRK